MVQRCEKCEPAETITGKLATSAKTIAKKIRFPVFFMCLPSSRNPMTGYYLPSSTVSHTEDALHWSPNPEAWFRAQRLNDLEL